MKRLLTIIAALGVLALLVTTTSCGSEAKAESLSTAPAQQKQDIEAYGTIRADNVKSITLDFNAPITKVAVKEGERVKAGQTLMTLDLSEMNAQTDEKAFELTAANKDIKVNLSSNDPQQEKLGNDLATAKAILDRDTKDLESKRKLENDLVTAKAVLDKDSKDLESKRKLFDAGAVPQADVDAAQKLVDYDNKNIQDIEYAIKSEVDAAQKLIDNDNKNIQDIEYAIKSLQNNKDIEKDQKNTGATALDTELKLLRNKLAKPYFNGSDVISDVGDGIAFEIGYTAGDIAGPQKKLLSILDLDSLVVVADVPEEFIKDVKLGSKATVIPVADKSRQYGGTVTYISGKAVKNNGETLVPVTITLDKKDGFLLPEFSVDVNINVAG